MSTSALEQKKALRKEVRARLKGLTAQDIQSQSQQVWERLFQLPEYQTCQSIGLFLSMPKGEIDTDPVLLDAVQKGKDIYVPEVGKNFEQADMELRKVIKGDADDGKLFHTTWPRNKWGIPEPPAKLPMVTAQSGDLDLLVVPGLAFDTKCDRLGQGKGYYDRFIERMMTIKPPKLIAVGLDCQLVDRVPTQEYDRRMDMVILPNQVLT